MQTVFRSTVRGARAATRAWVLAAAVTLATGLSACGSDNTDTEPEGIGARPTAAQDASFPRPANRSLRDVIGRMRQGPELAPGVSLLEPGRNRFGFALFDRANKQIADLAVAVYVAGGVDETAHGPYMARFVPIQVQPDYQSRTTAEDQTSAKSIYVADLPFREPGSYVVSAVTRLNRKLVAATPAQVTVTRTSKVPSVGDKAIRVSTPTRESVGGDIKQIETRVPPDTMHERNLANSLDKGRPVVVLFSTPALCQTRVCGPVTDVAEEVKATYGDRADFIHMEIYRDNDVNKGVRPQVRAWGLKTEPVLFVIDRRGVVAARIEGAFSAAELKAAVRKGLR
jgi:hypothetical protein